jgi:hypothetical protein
LGDPSFFRTERGRTECVASLRRWNLRICTETDFTVCRIIAGWIWIFSNIFVRAAVSLGVAHCFVTLFPAVPVKVIAVIICLVFSHSLDCQDHLLMTGCRGVRSQNIPGDLEEGAIQAHHSCRGALFCWRSRRILRICPMLMARVVSRQR